MKRGIVALLSLAVALGGCSGEPTQPTGNGDPRGPVNLDEAFLQVATTLPGFGGLFVDEDGVLNVPMVGADEAATAEDRQARDARIQRVLSTVLGPNYLNQVDGSYRDPASGDVVVPPELFRVVPANYDILQLSRWRASAEKALTIPGVILTDLDERRNCVTIGIESSHAREQVERTLRDQGVPLEAVIIEETEPIFFYDTLRSKIRPVDGGVQVEPDLEIFGNRRCTMGFNAIHNGKRGFVTNSHCTRGRGRSEGTDFHQPTDPLNPFADQQKVGDESFDPEFWAGGTCPEGQVCRTSDSAFIEYDESAFYGSRIARTSLWTKSLDIDDGNPSFRIVDEVFFPLKGTRLDKVGRTTGWTNGTVNRTCFTTRVGGTPNVTMVCQYDVMQPAGMDEISDGGDSGSPVFRRVGGSEIELYGILWGGPRDNSYFVFSSIFFIHLDLFPLIVEFPSPLPPDPRPLGCMILERCCERDPDGDCRFCVPRTASCP